MRPLRSFLLLLIFLACFTGLHYAFPLTRLFPPVNEFIPERLIKSLSGEAVQEPLPLQSTPVVAPGKTHTVEQPDFVTPADRGTPEENAERLPGRPVGDVSQGHDF